MYWGNLILRGIESEKSGFAFLATHPGAEEGSGQVRLQISEH